ncbi:carboxymuconolactone decarboxylase family protein [Catenuloplanes japonicus]|uniref:carboxymuconolactone decarboxylase family protein n=1 Tax=Catenuloplanes japonicus TaxID=33876 RepID=UPI000525BC1D|nr:carboxymuconolactone decarboxylase family protein [Catenuloplanes japonicus]
MSVLDVRTASPEAYGAMAALSEVAQRGLDPELAALVKLRVSQVNGCGFCVDMHAAEARAAGVHARKLDGLAAWRRTPFFDEAERHALALAEEVTTATHHAGPERALRAASGHFDAATLASLLWTISAVNAWNRIATATETVPAPLAPVPA